MELNILLNFFAAIALGALIGIERQRWLKGGEGFAGIRTFIMISLLGAIAAFLYQELSYSTILPIIFFAIAIFVAISYVISARQGYMGITAEISALITFFLGFLVMFDKFRSYGLIFGVLVTILLSFKKGIHKFVEEAKAVEWNDTIKFALIAFVILPLLPKEVVLPIFPEGPLYELNIINPKEIWLLVVFVSAISFVGYFIVKTLGERRGARVIGAMGGLVSSTAVTHSMASYSKTKVGEEVVSHKPLSIGVLLATLVSFVRVGIISISINQKLVGIIIPIGMLLSLGFIFYVLHSREDRSATTKLKLESPLRLKPALILGFLYAILTFFSKLSFALNLGKFGIVLASIITGFFDMDPIILMASTLFSGGTIGIQDAIYLILLAVASNQVTKAAIALTGGSKKFGSCVAKWLFSFVILIIAWIVYFRIL